LTEGKHDPIISQDIWDKAQVLFKEKSKASPREFTGVSLLTGLIKCPQCGSPMVASRTVSYLKDGTKVRRRYYSCGQFRTKGSSVCRANSVKAEYVECYVLDRLNEVLKHPRVLKDILAAVNKKRLAGIKPKRKELEIIELKLQQQAEKKRRVIDVFEMEAIDRETFTGRLDELTAEVDLLCARRSELQYELGEGDYIDVSYETVVDILSKLDELITQSSPEQKKTLLHMAIKEIKLNANKTIESIELGLGEQLETILKHEDPSAIEAEGSLTFSRPWHIVLVI
jgi:site-specific DNA recombinase